VDGHVAAATTEARTTYSTAHQKEGKPRDWTFQIKDGAMNETLVLPEDRTLHRKMSLQRIRKSA